MPSRISKEEARMFAIGAMSYGLPVNSNFFRSYFKTVTKRRAEYLEKLQEDFNEDEVALIKKQLLATD